jgi:hypothetical protein
LDRAKADQLKPRGKRPPGYANPQPKTTDDAEAQYEDAFAKILYVDSSDLIRVENEERELNIIYSQTKTDNFLTAIGIV